MLAAWQETSTNIDPALTTLIPSPTPAPSAECPPPLQLRHLRPRLHAQSRLGFAQALGSTRAYTNAVQYNTGWNFRFQQNTLVTGPFAGIDYLHGSINACSENGGGQSPGQSYMVAGAGVNFQFTDQLSLMLNYQGQFFRENMQAHFASVRLGFKF